MKDELFKSIQQGDTLAFSKLLEMATEITSTEIDSLLIFAVLEDEISIVQLLINCGANVNARDTFGTMNYGLTALMWAASRGNLAIVKLLLASGADAHGEDQRGITALIHADKNPFVRYRYDLHYKQPSWIERADDWIKRKKTAALLLKVGGKCYERDPEKRRDGATKRLLDAIPHPDDGPFHLYSQAKEAVELGADVNALSNGDTPLTSAVAVARWCRDFRFLNLLLQAGADVNARNTDGTTVLKYANSDRRVIRLLKNAGLKE